MNEARVRELWQKFQNNEIRTEREFRALSGFTRETYNLPRKSDYRQGSITNTLDAVWDLKNDRRVRFYGASTDGWWIMILGNDGRTFEGIRRPYELHAH